MLNKNHFSLLNTARFTIVAAALSVTAISVVNTGSSILVNNSANIPQLNIDEIKNNPIISSPAYNISDNLFGGVNDDKKLPITSKLDIKLLGVIPSSNPKSSIAILRYKSNSEEIYSSGSAISNGIILEEVGNDSVIINVHGSREIVYFPESKPEPDTKKPPTVTPPAKVTRSLASTSPKAPISSRQLENETFMRSVMSNPLQIIQNSGLALSRDGLEVKANSFIGSHLGLAQGDKVLSVNGMPVTQLLSSPQTLKSLRGSKVSVLVSQNGSQNVITVQVP